MIYLDLLLGFLKVGLFTFGGGYAAIPLIREIVILNSWLTEDSLFYMIAVSESTPGPIMVNLATYVGNSQGGFLGALVSTFAVILPSFVIILLIMSLLKTVIHNKYTKAVLNGLKPCITGIIVATGLYMTFSNVFVPKVDIKGVLILIVLFSAVLLTRLLRKKRMSPILLICLSAVVGVGVYSL